ncbi:MAG TPA: FkbM family methyltransferase [Acidimicrobiales bacterium]|nr:FkbM family methyltransferase [Acidimicrobiales bacterium]
MIRPSAVPIEVDCSLFTGQQVRVVIPEIVGTDIYRHGYIEPDLTRVLIGSLRPGAVFIDVGAHYGYHSLIASQIVEPGGLVVAFEPTRGTFELLRRNVGDRSNVRARQAALGEAPATVSLHDYGPSHSALNTPLDGARVPAGERHRLRGETYPVPCLSLDQFVTMEALAPDIVKLDAEGSELSILRGMRRLLSDRGPMITLETGDYQGMPGPRTGACIDYLESFGYRCLEYADGLRPHRRESTYGYGNLYFVKSE